MRNVYCTPVMVLALALGGVAARGEELSISEIQSNTVDGDASVYNGLLVDCSGGICVGKYPGSRPRLVLQDPSSPEGWGGIQVKDWTGTDLYNHVNIGDWVALTNVLVEEFRGTTYLQWQVANNPSYTVLSQGNTLPAAITLAVSAVPAPVYDPIEDGWFVENHDAEPYESMRMAVWGVTVTDLDLGKAADNYNLQDNLGNNCWASDYLNADKPPGELYMPAVETGQCFRRVAGILEQYTSISTGWDYYQLLTQQESDLWLCNRIASAAPAGVERAADPQEVPPP